MSHRRGFVVAIDGPAASGKSTTARIAAERLGYLHVDTGAMYRAVTLKVLRSGIPVNDEAAIAELVATTHVELRNADSSQRVLLDGAEVTGEIRSIPVTKSVSKVSSLKCVRAAMVREQRRIGVDGGIVLEGRDIGTVVFPDADLKFFLIAGIEARAKRRQAELQARGVDASLPQLRQDIKERDALDSTRVESPLRQADDAIELDTSDMTVEQQVEFVVSRVKEKLAREGNA